MDLDSTDAADLTDIEGKIDTIDSNVDAVLVDTGTTLPNTLGTPVDTDLSTDIANVQDTADAISAALGASALGQNWFVDGTTGSDSNDGLSPATAFATWQKAHDSMSSGDACFGQGGTYDENANATGLTITTANLRFVALPPFQAIITNTHGSATHCVHISTTNIAIENFLFSGVSRSLIGVECTTTSSLCTFRKCASTSCATGYKLAGAGGANAIYDSYSLLDRIAIDMYDDSLMMVENFLAITFFAGVTSRALVMRNGTGLNVVRDFQAGGFDTGIEIETGSDSNLIEKARLANNTTDKTDGGTNNVFIDYQLQSKISANQSLQDDLNSIYTRIGAPAGASVAVDIAAIKTVVDAVLVDTGTTLPASLATIDGNVDTIVADTPYIHDQAISSPVTNSVADIVNNILEHVHGQSLVYPTGAASVTVTGDAANWTLGNFAQIVPASTIGSNFTVTGFLATTISDANTIYEIVFYYGAGQTEFARKRFHGAVVNRDLLFAISSNEIPANSKIEAKVMTANGGGDTVDISIEYHLHG